MWVSKGVLVKKMARNHGNIVLNCEDVKVLYDDGELDTRGPFQITHN